MANRVEGDISVQRLAFVGDETGRKLEFPRTSIQDLQGRSGPVSYGVGETQPAQGLCDSSIGANAGDHFLADVAAFRIADRSLIQSCFGGKIGLRLLAKVCYRPQDVRALHCKWMWRPAERPQGTAFGQLACGTSLALRGLPGRLFITANVIWEQDIG